MPALCTNTLNGIEVFIRGIDIAFRILFLRKKSSEKNDGTHSKNSAFEWPNAEITCPTEIEKGNRALIEQTPNMYLFCPMAQAPILILKQEILQFAGILQNEIFYKWTFLSIAPTTQRKY